MLAVLVVTFPFFALVLCGYVATLRGALPLPAIAGLNVFVLYFALPCMLFRFGASTPVLSQLSPGAVAVYVVSALVVVAFTVVATVGFRIGLDDAAFGALVAAFPNTGYMGVPMLVALLGAAAAGPAIATILIDLVFTSSLCVALSHLDRAGEHGAAATARDALKGAAANPLPWAIALGIAVWTAGLELPAPVAGTIGLLADAASPVALFTTGAVLARARMTATRHTPLADYAPVALVKLVVHPFVVWALGESAISLGVALDRSTLTVLVLVAALPSASNVVMLAERFGADSGRIARIIMLSTALAFATFSAAVALLAPR
ncbi:MAG: AEC family transporter [Burkholderiales bacterium]